jgi:hypothetical protein
MVVKEQFPQMYEKKMKRAVILISPNGHLSAVILSRGDVHFFFCKNKLFCLQSGCCSVLFRNFVSEQEHESISYNIKQNILWQRKFL